MLSKIKNKLHILHNIYIKHKYLKNKETYSMDGEDLVIFEYFKNRKKGLYIDVGCYHPIHRNNTFLLYKKGWKGINIDIHNFSIELFKFLRPDDLNYNFAVSDKNEKIKMYFQKELSQISTIDNTQAKKAFQGNIKEKIIQSYTLNEVMRFSKLEDIKIDILDVDVEGADYKVLKGLSFEKFKPEIICVEIHDREIKVSETFKLLDANNYDLIWSGVFSHIFRHKN